MDYDAKARELFRRIHPYYEGDRYENMLGAIREELEHAYRKGAIEALSNQAMTMRATAEAIKKSRPRDARVLRPWIEAAERIAKIYAEGL